MSEMESDNTSHLLTRAKQNIVFCVLILLFNGLCVLLILTSKKLRSKSKFRIILSMSLANILSGVIYLPLDTQLALGTPPWTSSIRQVSLLQIGHMIVVPSVLALSVVFIVIDFMYHRHKLPDIYTHVLFSCLGITIPWGFSFLAFVLCGCYPSFLFTDTLSKEYLSTQGDLQAEGTHVISLRFVVCLIEIWGCLPLVLAITLGVSLIFLGRNAHTPGVAEMHFDDVDSLPTKPEILDIVVSAAVIFAFNVPFIVEVLGGLSCGLDGECVLKRQPRHAIELFKPAVSFILPAVWTLDGTFRNAAAVFVGKICPKSCVVI